MPTYQVEIEPGHTYGVMSNGVEHLVIKVTRSSAGLHIEPVAQVDSLVDAYRAADSLNG